MHEADARREAPIEFAEAGAGPRQWSNGPGDRYAAHVHDYRKLLLCIAGSITFHLAGYDVELGPGDRLDVPAGARHSATVGPMGVVCLEAQA